MLLLLSTIALADKSCSSVRNAFQDAGCCDGVGFEAWKNYPTSARASPGRQGVNRAKLEASFERFSNENIDEKYVFLGSSTISKWNTLTRLELENKTGSNTFNATLLDDHTTLVDDWAPLPVAQWGWSGGTWSHLEYYMRLGDGLFTNKAPRCVIVFLGTNDIAILRGEYADLIGRTLNLTLPLPISLVVDGMKSAVRYMLETMPGVKIILMTASPTPDRAHLNADFEAYFRETKRVADDNEDVYLADLYTPYINLWNMLGADGLEPYYSYDGWPNEFMLSGAPNPYGSGDGLHQGRIGYLSWMGAISAAMQRCCNVTFAQ